MTPLHLSILLNHNCRPDMYEPTTKVSLEYSGQLLGLGLLQDCPGGFNLTPKGDAFLEHILKTPMPTQKWVWEKP